MTQNILSPTWSGHTADPLDPLDQIAMRFKAAPAPVFADCQGCLFIGQRSEVCWRACDISGMDCDDALPNGQSMIFILDKSDQRQLSLIDNDGKP